MAPRRRLVLLLLCGLLVVAVAVAVVAVRGRSAPVVAVDQGRQGTVLLVPGYGGSTSSLTVLAGALHAAGRRAQVVRLAGDGTGDLAAQARRVQAAAQAALDGGAPSVDVVGYSAGGVITRVWLDGVGAGTPVRRVVTLGSPHQGTDLATFAGQVDPGQCPTACRQLAPGSDLLTGLAATPGAGPDGSVWTSVWSATDEVVTPPRTASALPGALDVELQAVCPGVDVAHGDLPRDAEAVALVDAALDGPPLRAVPAASRCAALRAAGQRLLAA